MSDRTAAAPSSFNQHIFFSPASVFYGTDDGYQDGSLTELEDPPLAGWNRRAVSTSTS